MAARHLLIGKTAPPSLLAKVQTAIGRVPPNVFVSRLRAVLDCDARADLGRVAVPLLYLQTKHDRLVPVRSFDEIRQIRPETELLMIDGPHLLLQREPREAAAAIAEFIDRLR